MTTRIRLCDCVLGVKLSFWGHGHAGRVGLLANLQEYRDFIVPLHLHDTRSVYDKNDSGTYCLVPDGFTKLAGPWRRCCRRLLSAPRVVRPDSTAPASSGSYIDRRLADLSHLQFPSSAYPTYPRLQDGKKRHTVWQFCLPETYHQTPLFLLRQQMPLRDSSLLPVGLVRLLCHRAEAHHSLT